MFEHYSDLARQAIFFARKEAGETGAATIDTEHLLIGVQSVHPELPKQLAIEIDLTSVRNQAEQHSSKPAIPDAVDLPISPDLGRVFQHAISIADVQQCREVRTEHLIASMLEEGGHAGKLLTDLGLDKKAISNLISNIDCCMPQQQTEESRRAMSSMLSSMLGKMPM